MLHIESHQHEICGIRHTHELVNIPSEWFYGILQRGTRKITIVSLHMVVDIDCVGCMEGDGWVSILGYDE